jgi:hypothetical protein
MCELFSMDAIYVMTREALNAFPVFVSVTRYRDRPRSKPKKKKHFIRKRNLFEP